MSMSIREASVRPTGERRRIMQYALLIYSDEKAEPAPGTKEFQDYMGAYGALTREVKEKGIYLGGVPLQPVATATTVRVRKGATATTDGPFAETKEQLGGFYLLDCKDLDEALEYAGRIPTSRHGSIEVRPVLMLGK
jgi:hypothetical protein